MWLYSDNVAISAPDIPWALPNICMQAPFPITSFSTFFFFHFSRVYTAIMTVPQSMCFPSSHKSLCYPSFLLCSSSDCHHSPRAAGWSVPAEQRCKPPHTGGKGHSRELCWIRAMEAVQQHSRTLESVRGVLITTFTRLSSAQLQAPPHWMHTHCLHTHTLILGTQKLALIVTLHTWGEGRDKTVAGPQTVKRSRYTWSPGPAANSRMISGKYKLSCTEFVSFFLHVPRLHFSSPSVTLQFMQ